MVESLEEQLAFCRRLHPQLVRSLALYCGRVDVAEELTQEALARACDRWAQVSRLDRPDAWVYRVAYNLARSWFRRRLAERRAFTRHGARDEHHEDPDVADSIAVRDALAGLSERQRLAVILRYYADLPISDAAALMRCAPGTVQSLSAKALSNLRASLDDETPSLATKEAQHGD